MILPTGFLKFLENIRFEEPPPPENLCPHGEGAICWCTAYPSVIQFVGHNREVFEIKMDVRDGVLYLWQ